jgi:hypothetical protein
MKLRLFVAILLVTSLAQAKENRYYQKGLLAEMSSTECGYHEKSGKGFIGSVIGTDSAKRDVRQTLCQEYVLKSDKVTYRIRPRNEKKPELLPIGERIEFRIKKDRMLLKLGDSDKEIEYNVVSMMAVETHESGSNAVAAGK